MPLMDVDLLPPPPPPPPPSSCSIRRVGKKMTSHDPAETPTLK